MRDLRVRDVVNPSVVAVTAGRRRDAVAAARIAGGLDGVVSVVDHVSTPVRGHRAG